MELRLDGDLADERVFPAVDLVQSGTRHEAALVGEQEHAILEKLRRGLTAERRQQGCRAAASGCARPRPTTSC